MEFISNLINKIKLWFRKLRGGSPYLCDTCKWDWRSSCHNRQRPKVSKCSEYKKRG